MTDNFDLFGDPIAANHGGRGRPQHVPTVENRNRVNMLLACGWSNERIAATLRVTLPTLRKHYFSELKSRAVARDRLDASVMMRAWDGVQKGNVSAIRLFGHLLERNDLMNFGQTTKPRDVERAPAGETAAKAEKVGKKEAAVIAAHSPDAGTPLGELMMRRQQSH
ncbi:MAG: hypothetical protein J0H42_04265 [Rhizobiales bacterium]|nr:hypothetical protein [Hyphomicrobiales bacterium]